MTPRPYITLGFDELERLAQSNESNAQVIEDLIEELGHRKKNPKAQRLKLRLERPQQQPNVHAVNPDDSDGTPVHRVGDQMPASWQGSLGLSTSSSDSADNYSALALRYESLRATFTVEAELLARWGMTPLLPHHLQDLVFDEWLKKLKDGQHGRLSISALNADRARIAEERAFLARCLKVHKVPGNLPVNGTPFSGETRD